jgi:predicted ATPase
VGASPKIRRVQIENFRSIKSLDILLPNTCAIVGPNSCGKSNVLLALHRVLGRDWVNVIPSWVSNVRGLKLKISLGLQDAFSILS